MFAMKPWDGTQRRGRRGLRKWLSVLLVVTAFAAQSEEKDNDPNSRLITACRAGKLDEVKADLAEGASLTYKNQFGETALMNAADAGKPEVVRFLLEKGADPAVTNPIGRTALSFALMRRDEDSACALIKGYSDPAKLRDGGSQPEDAYLLLAVKKNARSALMALLDKKVPPDPVDRGGRTPLSFCCEWGLLGSVGPLLSHGANPNRADGDGRTPYVYAAEIGRGDILHYLTEAGASPSNVPLRFPTYPVTAPLTESQRWCLGVAELLMFTNSDSCEILGGRPAEEKICRATLHESWGIDNKADAMRILYWLMNTGQRGTYARVLNAVTAGNDWALKLKFTTDELATIRKEAALHSQKGFVAWDFCRVVSVAGWSYRAGYLPEDKAWGFIFEAAKKLQSTYGSWKELSDDYILGRAIWQRRPQYTMNYLQKRLLDPSETSSPWQLPWKTPLKE